MNVHVVVSVFQGVPSGVKVYFDTTGGKKMAEQGLAIAKADLEIEEGEEEESENAAELFENVPVF